MMSVIWNVVKCEMIREEGRWFGRRVSLLFDVRIEYETGLYSEDWNRSCIGDTSMSMCDAR